MRNRMRRMTEARTLAGVLAIGGLAVGLWIAAAGLEAQDDVEKRAVAKGRISYNRYCKSCHGQWGQGDGPVAGVLKVPPADLTAIAQRNGGEFPFDEVFKTIDGRKEVAGHGLRDMPIWGKVFQESEETTDEQVIEKVAQLAYFVKSIQKQGER